MAKEQGTAAGILESATQFGPVLVYNGSDHEAVIAIYDELKRRGLKPWIASRNQRPGADWRKAFTAAVEHASAVLVFCGPNGTGPWQDQEIPFIHSQCVKTGIHVIPVLLPGGEIPDDMLFAGRNPVDFRAGPKDHDALDQLEFGITDRNPQDRRGRFEILAEVPSTERACFLAVSHATPREIYELMVLAALDAGLLVKQPREFSASAHNVYAPDVAVAIRSATVILADGTPHPETKKADADVMYEVGLAQALAKPTVFVSTPRSTALPLPIFVCGGKTCSHVEYDRSEVNFAGPLRQKVADRLREILGGMRPPHLIFDNDMGLRVAYSEVHHHRAEFWQPFEQIMNFGLTIKRMFGEILKHVYKMQQIVDLAHADAMALSATSEASLRQFRDVYEQYCKPYAKEIEISGSWIVAKTDAEEGFKDLLAILDKTEDVNRSIQSIVRQSFQFFQILECYLDEYLRAHDALLARTGNRSPNTLHHVIHLHAGVQSLAVSVHGFLRNWSSLAGVCIV